MSEGYKITEVGEIPDSWKVIKLLDTGKIVSGGTPDSNVKEFCNGNIAWCTPTDITALKGQRYIYNTTRTIAIEGLRNSSATLLPKGSLVICTRATIGDCAINQVTICTN
jgi:type I restriction enzyme S subunit